MCRPDATPECPLGASGRPRVAGHRGPAPGTFLLCTEPWSKRIHRPVSSEVFDRAEIVGKKPSHGLRYTVASDLVQSGAPIHVAQKHLGHASASVTLGIYSHAQKAGMAQAGRALEEYRRANGQGEGK